jgi:hypothetical protein
MIYMLEFLGFLAVAFSLAASPVLVNLLERFFSPLDDDGRTATGYELNSALTLERAEMRDERESASIDPAAPIDGVDVLDRENRLQLCHCRA